MSREMKRANLPGEEYIPESWETPRLKDNAYFINGDRGKNYPSGEDIKTEGIPFLTSDNIHSSIVDIARDGAKYITEEKYNSMHGAKLRINDLIYCLRGSVGLCALNKELTQGTIASSLVVIRPKATVIPEFLNYVMNSAVIQQQNDNYMNGSCAANLSAENVRNYNMPFPQIEEQKAIVSFLSVHCAYVDSAISKHHQIIEKLEEYRKAVITQTVTKGLNPNVEMKDSGVNWIGEIPASWTMTRVKFLGTYRNGLTYTPDDVCAEDEGVLVLRSSNIQNGKISLSDNVYVSCDIKDDLMVRNGDILICSRNGSADLIGKNALINNLKATYGAFMMVFRPYCNSKYMYYVLNSNIFENNKAAFMTSTVNQLTANIFGNMAIPYCPDSDEQVQIAEYLDEKCERIDSMISQHNQLISKLQEYKQSLIYNAVTGKIDCTTEASA